MFTATDICNIALARIGVDRTIVDLASEQSKEAHNARRFYQLALDEVLEKVPWPFAVKVQALALIDDDSTLLPGWGYAYAQPADMVQLLELVPDGDVGEALGYYTNCACDAPWMPCRGSRYSFRKALSGDGSVPVILAAIDDAWAVYTSRVENTAAFPSQMVSLIADRLAMELAMPMTADPRWFQVAQQRYQAAFPEVAGRAYEQEGPVRSSTSPSILARS